MTLFTRHYIDYELFEVSMDEIETLINDCQNKKKIAEYVYQRLYNRFLKIFDYKFSEQKTYKKGDSKAYRKVFNEEFKNGFLIMTSCSLLIETLASFITGSHKM